jgi:Uma2 family endonuclease
MVAATVFSHLQINLPPSLGPFWLDGTSMTRAEFYEFCTENPDLRIERDAEGTIFVMPPTTSETGRRNSEIHLEIGIWNRKHRLGVTFDSSTGFELPNGAERSPDTAWITNERWNALAAEQQRRFAPIVPDFVIELRSDDQSLKSLREKMTEYVDNGCHLGWLVDPQARCTYVYYANGDIQTIAFDDVLSGGALMPGLEVRLAEVLA